MGTLTIDRDMESIADLEAFTTSVRTTIASALNVVIERVEIFSVRYGSVVVTVDIRRHFCWQYVKTYQL